MVAGVQAELSKARQAEVTNMAPKGQERLLLLSSSASGAEEEVLCRQCKDAFSYRQCDKMNRRRDEVSAERRGWFRQGGMWKRSRATGPM